MTPKWFRGRGYRHFDSPVGEPFAAKVTKPKFVAQHHWSPLISYSQQQKRYKPSTGKTVFKDRPIMYASHRDACILSYYAAELSRVLDKRYVDAGMSEAVIAYRKLGKANYDFTAKALSFAEGNAPCVILCFDVSGFFDNIDHKILKANLARVIGVDALPDDWYAVFKNVTKFRHVPLSALKANLTFGERLKARSHEPIATISEVLDAGIVVEKNPNGFGIPQGTPISAVLSNVYMFDLDVEMIRMCEESGAFYQRYSDDILIICPIPAEVGLTTALDVALSALKLQVKAEKTERALYDAASPETVQYLGFNISPEGVVIRPSSLSKQWRKVRRNLRRTEKIGRTAVSEGKTDKIFTRKLRQRFLPGGGRNFSSYARRSANALGSKKMVRQVRRLERWVERAINDLNP